MNPLFNWQPMERSDEYILTSRDLLVKGRIQVEQLLAASVDAGSSARRALQ